MVSARHAEGQSASLADGLAALAPSTAAALVLLGDQPTVSPAAIRAVATAFRPDGPPIVRARYGGRPGHPVLLARRVWPELRADRGDRGARDLIARRPDSGAGGRPARRAAARPRHLGGLRAPAGRAPVAWSMASTEPRRSVRPARVLAVRGARHSERACTHKELPIILPIPKVPFQSPKYV